MTVTEHNLIRELPLWAQRERRPKVARRLQLVVMAQKGLQGAEMAALMGESLSTVARWIGRYNAEGIEELADRPRPGKPPTLPRNQEQAFCDRLEAGPTELDAVHVFRGWNIQQILEAKFGATDSLDGVSRL